MDLISKSAKVAVPHKANYSYENNHFDATKGVIELSQVKPEQEVEPKERPRRKPRILFTPERIKGLPIKVIEIDPAGDLSSLKKIGTEDHYVLNVRPARLRILHYVRNRYVNLHI